MPRTDPRHAAARNTVLVGYSVITAANPDEALAVAKGCSGLARDGGAEVAQLGEVPTRTGDQAAGSPGLASRPVR
jgi:hypothetical protein